MWWTTWKVILVTGCSAFLAMAVGSKINEALAKASDEKTSRLADRERGLTQRAQETTAQAEAAAKKAQAEAEKARWEAEKASMDCACDRCVNFADANEVKTADQEVG